MTRTHVYNVEPLQGSGSKSGRSSRGRMSPGNLSRSATISRESVITDYLESRPSTTSSFTLLKIWERHPVFMTFTDPLTEEEFVKYFHKRFHLTLRKVYIMATLLILALATPAAAIKWPDHKEEFTILSLLTVGVPGFIVSLIAYSGRFEGHAHHCTAFLSAMVTIAPMYAAARVEEHQDMNIITSIILLFGGVAVLARLSFPWSVTIMTLVISSYTAEMLILGLPDNFFQASGFLFPLVVAAALFAYVARNNDRYMRDNFIREKKSERDYNRLKEKINKIKNRNQANDTIDLDSGMEKAIASLMELKGNASIGDAEAELLDGVISLLKSPGLLAPSLMQPGVGPGAIDEETHQWLMSELASKEREKTRVRFADTPKMESFSDKDFKYSSMILPGETEKAIQILRSSDRWNLDIFQLAIMTQGEPLRYVALHLFRKHNLLDKYSISEKNLDNFVRKLESGYPDNRFHNRIHAADVTLNVDYLISTGPLAHVLTNIERLAIIIAALVHDFRHPGQNNNFQVNTGSDIALTYNDRSVLENYHVSQAFRVIRDEPDCNIFSGMEDSDRKDVRELVIDTVLATDMAMHFEIMSTFKTKLASELELEKRHDRVLLLKMAIKCADIAHTTKKPALHHEWTSRVQEEFFLQGDQEKARGVPVSPFMDRVNANVPKSQVGFLDFVVKPLFEAWSQYSPDHSSLLTQLEENHDEWKRRAGAGTS